MRADLAGQVEHLVESARCRPGSSCPAAFSLSRRPTGPVAPGLSVARRPTAALMTSSGVARWRARRRSDASPPGSGGATATGSGGLDRGAPAPVTDSKSMFQSRPSGGPPGAGQIAPAQAAATGAGGRGCRRRPGAADGSRRRRARRPGLHAACPSGSGSAGAGCTPCSRLSNMSHRGGGEHQDDVHHLGVISSSPLRSLSKRFSVR